MTDEPTAWEEINPPMVSAPRRGPPSRCSETDPRLTFRNELTACLTLTAPVGMTEEARRDWLAVAWNTLKHLPPDVLTAGCQAARLSCDHPSKIVPAIIAATKQQMEWRRNSSVPTDAPRLAAPEICSPEAAKEILSEFGLKRDWSGEVGSTA
jgi:hypothetical protein